jgi:mitochondrial fission protein ELM1
MVKKTGLYINIALHASMQDISPLTKKKKRRYLTPHQRKIIAVSVGGTQVRTSFCPLGFGPLHLPSGL